MEIKIEVTTFDWEFRKARGRPHAEYKGVSKIKGR